jgi:hypothetical protein
MESLGISNRSGKLPDCRIAELQDGESDGRSRTLEEQRNRSLSAILQSSNPARSPSP